MIVLVEFLQHHDEFYFTDHQAPTHAANNHSSKGVVCSLVVNIPYLGLSEKQALLFQMAWQMQDWERDWWCRNGWQRYSSKDYWKHETWTSIGTRNNEKNRRKQSRVVTKWSCLFQWLTVLTDIRSKTLKRKSGSLRQLELTMAPTKEVHV